MMPAVTPQNTEWLPQVVDGFSYNANVFYLANRFFPNALAQLDILRRAKNYRARWWVVPDSADNPLQPYQTLFYQCEVADGSYLWGWSFAVISATTQGGASVSTTPRDICVEVVDSCSGIPLFMDFVCGYGLSTSGGARLYPCLLTQPRVILEPGLVNVQLSNRTANLINCQLILHFAEPCRVIDEETREAELRRMIQAGVFRR